MTEQRVKINRLDHLLSTGTEDIIRSINGGQVQRLNDAREVYEYVAKRIRSAKVSVDDVTWGFAGEERTQVLQEGLSR